MIETTISSYVQGLSDLRDPMKRVEMMIRGCVQFFPFQRASIFTYSPLNYIGEGILQVDNGEVRSMQSIKEDVRSFPPIYLAVSKNKPHFINLENQLGIWPNKYIHEYDLTSLFIIPISYLKTVVGCVLIDRYIGEYQPDEHVINGLYNYLKHAIETVNNDTPNLSSLSKREIESLQYLANGHGLKEIAQHLKISEFTVRDYLTSSIRKLGVNHRTEAVAVAFRRGIIL